MGNNLCSDVGNDPLPAYRPLPSTVNTLNTLPSPIIHSPSPASTSPGTALLQRSQWYDAKSKT